MANANPEVILRGKRMQKGCEAVENESKGRTNTIRVEAGNSMFYTKVPLNRIDPNVASSTNGNDSTGSSPSSSPLNRAQASVRIKRMAQYHEGSTRFPKLNECAHFHYDNVEFGQIQVQILNDEIEESESSHRQPDFQFTVRVMCHKKSWTLKRSYEDFRVLDKHLHRCIYDRRYSLLVELPRGEAITGNNEAVRSMLSHYLSRFSQIAGNMINCAPVLNWMELDNHGNHLIVSDESAINIPAVAAAHVIKRYVAQAIDELSLQVGEFVSVIDMPPAEDTNWWRGKKGFEVGFFPSQCVEVIGGKVPSSVISNVPKAPKPVLNKHGKLITFLRSFLIARPAKRRLKQSGILRERVYGCDLGEHLLNSGNEVPRVLSLCTEFIETNGVVDGIYRLSGVTSNIQRLRQEFDSETDPDMSEYFHDIHSVSSVLKLYFRELPNPLLTYQLYEKFSEAIANEEDRLLKITDVIQQLPPPHYRTVEFLMKHLSKISTFKDQTGMHSKNLAIVWAPNLLRTREIETGLAAFMEIRVQSVVVEYLIRNVHMIFSDKIQSQLTNNEQTDIPGMSTPASRRARPKSLVLSTPTKLLSLEEARARSGVQSVQEVPLTERQKFIEVGGGPSALPKQYHTVIDLPYDRKKQSAGKMKKSPSGWRAFFVKTRAVDSKRKLTRKASMPADKQHNIIETPGTLRSVRSAESLLSGSDASDVASTIMNPYADSDISPRRGSDSSLPKSTSHNSFFEGDSALAAMATNSMATSPHISYKKPVRRSVSTHRQRSYSETPDTAPSVEFIVGEVEFRKKRMRHSDTPRIIHSTQIFDELERRGSMLSHAQEKSTPRVDESPKPLPKSRMSKASQSPVHSNRSSASSQLSNSVELENGESRKSGSPKTSSSKLRRRGKRDSFKESDTEIRKGSTKEKPAERNSVDISQTNLPQPAGEEARIPTITRTEPEDKQRRKERPVSKPRVVFAQHVLPDQERVKLAPEDNFKITPYSTLESNVTMSDFAGSHEELLQTTAENTFNLDTLMSEYELMREKYLRQESASPVFSPTASGSTSPQPEPSSSEFFTSPTTSQGKSFVNPTYSIVSIDPEKTVRAFDNPTYTEVTIPPTSPAQAFDNHTYCCVSVGEQQTSPQRQDRKDSSAIKEASVAITDLSSPLSESFAGVPVLPSSDEEQAASIKPSVDTTKPPATGPSVGLSRSPSKREPLSVASELIFSESEVPCHAGPFASIRDLPACDIETSVHIREPVPDEREESGIRHVSPKHTITTSQVVDKHEPPLPLNRLTFSTDDAADDTQDTTSQSTPVTRLPPPIPPLPLGYTRSSPSLSPSSPLLSSLSPSSVTSPELRTPPPLPSPPCLHSPSFTRFSTTRAVFTFDEPADNVSEPSTPRSVTSSVSHQFSSVVEIEYRSSSSSSLSSRSTSSPVFPQSPQSLSTPVSPRSLSSPGSPRSLSYPGSPRSPISPATLSSPTPQQYPRSPSSESMSSTGERPPSSPRRRSVSPSGGGKNRRKGSFRRNPSPTNVAYMERDEKMNTVAAKLSSHHDNLSTYQQCEEPILQTDKRYSDTEIEGILQVRCPSFYDNETSPDDSEDVVEQGAGRFPSESFSELSKEPSSGSESDEFPLDESRLSVATLVSQYDNLETSGSKNDDDDDDSIDFENESPVADYTNVVHNQSYSTAVEKNPLSPPVT
ncbi:uncharacterized protein LOC144439652 isoform X2 [Glandiceps talaboti]